MKVRFIASVAPVEDASQDGRILAEYVGPGEPVPSRPLPLPVVAAGREGQTLVGAVDEVFRISQHHHPVKLEWVHARGWIDTRTKLGKVVAWQLLDIQPVRLGVDLVDGTVSAEAGELMRISGWKIAGITVYTDPAFWPAFPEARMVIDLARVPWWQRLDLFRRLAKMGLTASLSTPTRVSKD